MKYELDIYVSSFEKLLFSIVGYLQNSTLGKYIGIIRVKPFKPIEKRKYLHFIYR